jgi:hypothetical protein
MYAVQLAKIYHAGQSASMADSSLSGNCPPHWHLCCMLVPALVLGDLASFHHHHLALSHTQEYAPSLVSPGSRVSGSPPRSLREAANSAALAAADDWRISALVEVESELLRKKHLARWGVTAGRVWGAVLTASRTRWPWDPCCAPEVQHTSSSSW